MKTLIEKFTETVRLTATNFCLTDGLNRDGIDSISFTQHKRGLARSKLKRLHPNGNWLMA